MLLRSTLFLFSSLIWIATLCVAEPPSSPAFTNLLQGDDLSGWHGNNPHPLIKVDVDKRDALIESQQAEFRSHWTVDGNELVNDGHGAYATTDASYGDIEFRVDFKTVPLADSGIYLRGTPQVQIWDSTEAGGKWSKQADKGSGGLFNNSPSAIGQLPLVLADRPFGEWNQFRIHQVGSRTTVHLNDQLVVDNAIMENFWDRARPLPATGPIQLQTHGGEIRWKNILVREIGSDEANHLLRGIDEAQGFVSVFNGTSLDGWRGDVESYEVVDGAIVCREGKGGVLFTDEVYEDFVVRLEFLLPPAGNNGLAIRYPGKGRAAYDGMTELQVIDNDDAKYRELDARQYHGSAYGIAPAHRGYLRPIGEWNYQEVTVVGSKIRVELNGTVILDSDLSQVSEYKGDLEHPGKDLKQGHFGFAGHKDPVQFRRIAIKRL